MHLRGSHQRWCALLASLLDGDQGWRSLRHGSIPCQTLLRVVALSLDERQKPGFSSPGGELLPGLGLTSVAKCCTVTENPGFYPTLQ